MTYFEDDRLSDDLSAQHRFEREVCTCGHPLSAHHQLGACIVMISPSVSITDKVRDHTLVYCPCLDYEQVQG